MLPSKRFAPVHVMIPSVQLRSGFFVSALAHLGLVAAVLLLAEVRPFAEVPEQRVEVDVVTADEAPPEPEPAPKPEIKPALELPSETPAETKPAAQEPATQPAAKPEASKAEPSKPEAPRAEAPKPPQPEPAKPERQAEKPETPAKPEPPPAGAVSQSPSPQNTMPQSAMPQSAMPMAFPPAVPQEPDLTVKYSVALGLPADPTFDAPAELAADISAEAIAALRRKLKSCAALPPGVAPSDNVKIILRVPLLPDGRLAQEPFLIEASASTKGPALMKGAIQALTACQPYSMLPADKYKEWKVLDLDFTPQNFRGG